VFDKDFWEERYRSAHRLWSGRPNANLVAEAADLPPGAALDAGCGEGADALWLAARGWRVTAVDIAATALERAAAHAAGTDPDAAARVEWRAADLTTWMPPAAAFDLVSSQYVHLPAAERDGLVGRLAAAVAPGGTLLVVAHHPSDLHTTVGRPALPEVFYTAEELAAGLDPGRWEVLTADARPRSEHDPDGRPVTIHDTVLRARRLSAPRPAARPAR
jgi:SAM-dependent methyltransferase